MADQQTRLNRLMDEASIRNVIASFADSATRGDYDMFRTVWADYAEFTIGKPPEMQSATGVDDVVAMFRRLRTGRDFFVMFALPGVIEITGDEATTRTLCHESARGPGEKYYRNQCVGFDRLRRSNDVWVFTSRSFQYLWLDTSPFSGDGFPLFPDSAAA